MARAGRPRKHDPIANDISFAIKEMKNEEAKRLINQTQIDLLDGEGRTPLLWAALHANEKMLIWLIENGADINTQCRNGWCALHAASQNKHSSIVKILIDSGANPNLTDSYGNEPLWRAQGDEAISNILLTAGADADHKNMYDKSPNDMAAIKAKNLKIIAERKAKDKA